MTSSEEDLWFRKAGENERGFQFFNDHNSCLVSYVLRVSSSREITEADCKKVFTSLFRKVPNLRLCTDYRNGELWFKRLSEEKIDLEIIPDANIYETLHTFQKTGPRLEGNPLWTVKFLPWSDKHSAFVKQTSSGAPDRESRFTFVSHFIVNFFHAIIDGYSCNQIVRIILSLFEDHLAGNEIDDSVQVARLLDGNRETEALQKIESILGANPTLLQEKVAYLDSCRLETLIEKSFPVQPNLRPETFTLFQIFDEKTSSVFIKRCKQEGITVHCGFFALVEAAIFNVLSDAGVSFESLKISSSHCVDNRNYYGYDQAHDELGLAVSVCDVIQDINKNSFQDFWSYARRYHKNFKEQFHKRAGLERHVVDKLIGRSTMGVLDPQGQSKPSSKMTYYCSTNAKDVTPLLGQFGQNIHLEFFTWLSSCFTFPSIWISAVHTLRGELHHSLQYSAQLIERETAEQINEAISSLMKQIIEC